MHWYFLKINIKNKLMLKRFNNSFSKKKKTSGHRIKSILKTLRTLNLSIQKKSIEEEFNL